MTDLHPTAAGGAGTGAGLRVTCETGPAAGRTVVVGVGRHVIGRNPTAAIAIADPHVEVHHAVLDVGPDGSVEVTQIAGRLPCRREGDRLWLGASRLHLGDRPMVRDLAAAVATVADGPSWSAGALRASIGWGRPPGLVAPTSDDEAVEIAVEPGRSITMTGPSAIAVARAVVVQLTVWSAPDDWELIVETDDERAWAWCAPLPHLTAGVTAATLAEHLADRGDRQTVIVTDRPDLLARPEAPLRRALTDGAVAVVVVDTRGDVPSATSDVIALGTLGRGRWRRDDAPHDTVELEFAGIDDSLAARCARRVATRAASPSRVLPPPPLPARVTLGEVFERHGPCPIHDAVALAGRWRRASPPPPIVVGLTPTGVATIDPGELWHVPIGVVGAPGTGRTDVLRLLVVNLAWRYPPGQLAITLIGDVPAGCDRLPHVVPPGVDTGRRLLVVVDEPAGGLCADGLDAALASLAVPGAQLLIASPGPSALLDAALAHPQAVRIALRVDDEAAALLAVGETRPARAPRDRPGRAVLRVGNGDALAIQATWTGGDSTGTGCDDGDILISSVRHAVSLVPTHANMPGCADDP